MESGGATVYQQIKRSGAGHQVLAKDILHHSLQSRCFHPARMFVSNQQDGAPVAEACSEKILATESGNSSKLCVDSSSLERYGPFQRAA